MKHATIFIPGLGDRLLRHQRFLVATWRLWGVKPVFVEMNWADGKPFDDKFQRILELIDTKHAAGYRVSIVGVSAGAGAAINAFAKRKSIVNRVVLICGKVNSPEAIGPRYSGPNPAFLESAFQVQPSLDTLDFESDRKRIQSRYAFVDPIVPMRDSKVTGGINRTVPGIGHAMTIATQLVFGAPFYLHWLKKNH